MMDKKSPRQRKRSNTLPALAWVLASLIIVSIALNIVMYIMLVGDRFWDQPGTEFTPRKGLRSRLNNLRRGLGRSKKQMTEYVRSGKKIPIVLLACDRPDKLQETITNLLEVKGVKTSDIIIFQDGNMTTTENQAIADNYKIRLIQHERENITSMYNFSADLQPRRRGRQSNRTLEKLKQRRMINTSRQAAHSQAKLRKLEAPVRIALHYKFSLSTAFQLFPDAPCIIIVEDDLLFSPDFYEYFHKNVPILEADPTVFLMSAWNDNGFKGKVKDPYALRRTEFFPGLGWLLPRALYENELEQKWPSIHWDHWLRSWNQTKGREIVYPEVPRTYHNGSKGTFMKTKTHRLYFQNISYNRDTSISWEAAASKAMAPPYMSVMEDAYEARIRGLISKCLYAYTLDDVLAFSSNSSGAVLCVPIDMPYFVNGTDERFSTLASFFGIWHEQMRGAHRGLHEFHWNNDTYVLLLNKYVGELSSKESYLPLNPVEERIASS